MDELISRQSTIDALEQGFKDVTNGLDKFSPTRGLIEAVTGIYKCYIEQLQPIQSEIIRCKDCKHYRHGLCMKASMCVNKSENGFCDWAERREVTT